MYSFEERLGLLGILDPDLFKLGFLLDIKGTALIEVCFECEYGNSFVDGEGLNELLNANFLFVHAY